MKSRSLTEQLLPKGAYPFLYAALPVAPAADPLAGFDELVDVQFFLLNKLLVLAIVLLIFATVYIVTRFVKKIASPPLVEGTIKLALLGLLILGGEVKLARIPTYGHLVDTLQGSIVVICVANLVIFLIIDGYLQLRSKSRVPTFQRDLITLLVYLVFAIVSLRVIFHIEISSIVTTTTVLTAAVAFAMQSTLANILSGFSIQYDDNLRRSTWIHLKDRDITGEIINVGFRYTSLRTLENTTVMVPNSVIIQNVVTVIGNVDMPQHSTHFIKVSLGYDLPPERAKELLLRVLKSEPALLQLPEPKVLLAQFNDSGIDYQLRYVLKVYTEREMVKDRLMSRIWYAINREGYSFPFPHREILRSSYTKPFKLSAGEISASLSQVEILRVLTDRELALLAEQAQLRVFGPGETVVQQGEDGSSLFVSMRGRLQVMVGGDLVGEINPGDIFGEMSLLTGEPRQATVLAAEEVWLVEITHDEMEQIIRANPTIMEVLSSILVSREEKNAESRQLQAEKGIKVKKEEYLDRLRKFFRL